MRIYKTKAGFTVKDDKIIRKLSDVSELRLYLSTKFPEPMDDTDFSDMLTGFERGDNAADIGIFGSLIFTYNTLESLGIEGNA